MEYRPYTQATDTVPESLFEKRKIGIMTDLYLAITPVEIEFVRGLYYHVIDKLHKQYDIQQEDIILFKKEFREVFNAKCPSQEIPLS